MRVSGLRAAAWMALTAFVVSMLVAAACASAVAAGAAPGWEATGVTLPTNLAPGGSGILELNIYDAGSAATSGQISVTDVLPPGVTATTPLYYIGENEEVELVPFYWNCSGVGTSVLVCTSPEGLPGYFGHGSVHPGEQMQLLGHVSVSASASEGTEHNNVTIAGGGALAPAGTSDPVVLGSKPAGFGFVSLDGWLTSADGTPDTQAGSHPYELTSTFALNSVKSEEAEWTPLPADGHVRKIDVNLPPGIIGNPTAAPRCTRQQFDGNQFLAECPAATQIGVDTVGVGIDPERASQLVLPVYNMVPPAGVPAEFAFYILGTKIFLDAGVRTGGDYGITEHVNNLPQVQSIISNSITIWGVPGEASHDPQRRGTGSGCVTNVPPQGHGCSYPGALKPFLTLPTSCAGPQEYTVDASSWEFPSVVGEASFLSHDSSDTPTGFTGCDHLEFNPSISAAPDTGQADTPAGLTVDVKASQEGLVRARTEGFAEEVNFPGSRNGGLSASDIADTTVTLPEGVVINPGQAAGLEACQPDQDAIGTEGAPSCPLASKVGTVQIETPLLPRDLEGNVYVLQSNPPHLQLLVAASGEGVNLKLVGDVSLDPLTGRLTTTFQNTPELPFTDFKLSFSGGAQAALSTPTGCGTYATTSDFTSWGSPFLQDVFPSSSFAIDSGPLGSACASPLPFTPQMSAGSTTDQAGGFTNFSLLLTRADDQQRIGSLQFKTPEGLLGMISKVPLCGEPQAAEGACPAASQIGHTVVEAGPGPYPLVVPQPGQPPAPIYLTGGYKGAPYGLSIVVPLVVGPFTLQTQVVRARIEVDPRTTQLTVTTDPLPSIIDGIPADLRAINAVIDKPGFMFNPTDCEPQSFSGTATSTEGTTAPLESHFQMGSCRALTFKPNFKVSTSAHTSRTDGASLDVKLLYPTGALGANQASSQANIKSVKVELPRQLPSRLTTLQKACTAAVFDANPGNCPTASVVGHATAITPVLPVPLTGPAYFVSHGGEAFPALIVVLQGYGVTVDLEGGTFISKAGITSSTFKQVPDVPITSFELTLPQGPFSALTGLGNLCKGSLTMPTDFVGQNGAVLDQKTRIAVTGCPRHKVKKRLAKKRKRAGGRRGHATRSE
ncbi:MAG TPA: hypothetical protein VNV42_09990 [Solirubrobacteraceae bacterium]|jgi:hypothetical protein|nr:hypothetical protein [Solirubrobacteraceae bacterium]